MARTVAPEPWRSSSNNRRLPFVCSCVTAKAPFNANRGPPHRGEKTLNGIGQWSRRRAVMPIFQPKQQLAGWRPDRIEARVPKRVVPEEGAAASMDIEA